MYSLARRYPVAWFLLMAFAGVFLAIEFGPHPVARSLNRRLAEAHNKANCKPCNADAAVASVLPGGVLGGAVAAQTGVCSWGIKDFSENHFTLTTAGPGGGPPVRHHHIQSIAGPCKAAGMFPCKGVIVKMLAKEHLGQNPPWDVKALTCEAVSIGCGLGIDPTTEGLYDAIDEEIVNKHGTGRYFIAVDLYRGSCDPLGSHVYGETYEFTL